MIAKATPADIDDILPLIELRHREMSRTAGRFDMLLARAKLIEMTHPMGVGIVGIIRDGDPVVASVGLTVARFWDTSDHHLEDLWTFVHPEHRKSSHLKDLIAFAKGVSNQMGLRLIMLQAESKETLPQIEFVLARQLSRVGLVFQHEPIFVKRERGYA
jgi:hypothetical protein